MDVELLLEAPLGDRIAVHHIPSIEACDHERLVVDGDQRAGPVRRHNLGSPNAAELFHRDTSSNGDSTSTSRSENRVANAPLVSVAFDVSTNNDFVGRSQSE
jgi:hypothetical protein